MKNDIMVNPDRKKTIFTVGLFPGANQHLMTYLCRRFRVITFQGHFFEPSADVRPEIVEDILSQSELGLDHEEAFWEIGQFFDHLKSQVRVLFPNSTRPMIDRQEYASFHAMCFSAFVLSQLFRKLAAKVKIDMVVSNADYSGLRRPVIIEAKRLGIPTLDIEHGFFAAGAFPESLTSTSAYSNWFAISDYVNLDNNLERDYWEAWYDCGKSGDQVEFIVNGTPNDLSYDPAISKKQALRRLDLQDEQCTVTIASTWMEAHQPSTVVRGQIDHAEFFKTALRAMAKLKRTDKNIQIIIKLHPAFASKPVWQDAVSYLKRLSASMNLQIDLITCTNLSEIIAASDLMICPHASSLLWEFFLADKPGIVFPLPSFYRKTYDAASLNDSNILFRENCLKYVFNENELLAAIRYYLDRENQAKYLMAAHAIRTEKGVQVLTVEEKCQNICNWIDTFFEEKTPPQSSHEVAIADAQPDKGRADWLFATARQLIDGGNIREGLSLLSQVLQFSPAHAETLKLMGDIYHEHGQEERAHEMWRIAEASSA